MVWLLRLPLLTVAGLGLLTAAVISGEPRVGPSPAPTPADSVHAHNLGGLVLDALGDPSRSHTIMASQQQLDALERLANHGVGWVRPRFELADDGATVDVTADLGRGAYLNVSARVGQSANGFPPVSLTIGTIPVPEPLTRWLLTRGLMMLDLPAPERRLDRFVRQFRVAGDKRQYLALVRLQPDPELIDGLKAAPGLGSSVEPELVRLYYNALLDRDLRTGFGAKSLATFTSTAFSLAAQRSQSGDPAAETRAALVAMSLFTIGSKATTFSGKFNPFDAACVPQPAVVTLAGRTDLPKHFALSAVLSALFEDRLSRAAGEWKELNDSTPGGSGFSFVDLMADRAGLRLGMAVNGDTGRLRELQQRLARAGEERLLPVRSLNNYQEGLTAIQFQRGYRSINDERYRRVVARIDNELDRIPLYRITPRPGIG